MIAVSPNPDTYAKQFSVKKEKITALFSQFNPPTLEAFPSPPLHYRQRAEFKIWHEGDCSHYAIFCNGKGQPPSFVDDFPTANKSINQLMPLLRAEIEKSELLRRRLFQVEFLSTTTNDTLVTLIYHKPLDAPWEEAAKDLSARLNIQIIGRSRKQKLVLQNEFVQETLNVDGKTYRYRQLEGCFSQPNAAICEAMLNWATDCVKQKTANGATRRDLLELYCGNGNFTLPLAAHFEKVLATEISKPLTHVAVENCNTNNVNNISFARLSAEDISAAINGVREFRRLAHIALDDYNFSTVFVDPPRAGLDKATEAMVQEFDTILYISCNPHTLVNNLERLHSTHQIERFAFFDQFPYTDHMECGVLLSRR